MENAPRQDFIFMKKVCIILQPVLTFIYKQNTKIKKKDLDKILIHDYWLEADQCLKNGFVDEII